MFQGSAQFSEPLPFRFEPDRLLGILAEPV
jgi:hypothetical protein